MPPAGLSDHWGVTTGVVVGTRSFQGSFLAGAAAAVLVATFAAPAQSATRADIDGDGIPTRWERSHGLDPHRAADALRDLDHDRLTNRVEFRLGIRIRDEDSDNDGMDDGDEVRDGLRSSDVDDADTDGDHVLDGDENADHDGLDNEDEDDTHESCAFDDDDSDHDSVDDEDENELGLQVGSSDTDGDGITDGNDGSDDDGVANEDLDDSDNDDCDGDRDHDGENDEDEGDLLGTIAAYDADSSLLTVTLAWGGDVHGRVTDDTEITFDNSGHGNHDGDEDAAAVDVLQPGLQVAEIDLDDKTGDIEKIELLP